RHGYSALFTRVQELAFALTELNIIEPKTKDKARYAQLGVEDIKGADSTSITLKDKQGQTLASLIVGKERIAKGGNVRSRYVRPVGGEQAFLVEGTLDVSAEAADWMEKNLVDISPERIQSVTIAHPGGETVSLSRKSAKEPNFKLAGIKPGHKLRSQVTLNSIASSLQSLSFQDVEAQKALKWPEKEVVTTFHAFDGLVAKATSANLGDKSYTRFAFSFDPSLVTAEGKGKAPPEHKEENKPEASPHASTEGKNEKAPSAEEPKKEKTASEKEVDIRQEVEKLNQAVSDWAYQLPDFQLEKVTSTLDKLVAPEEKDKKKSEKEDNKRTDKKSVPRGMNRR
ncbi:MAG: DUF4340 domain-containing protein, partial [Gammaproteobacteria bacterium]